MCIYMFIYVYVLIWHIYICKDFFTLPLTRLDCKVLKGQEVPLINIQSLYTT